MNNPYSQQQILTQPLGNNAFAWQEREVLYGHSPTLTIPSLIDGTVDDIVIGDDIVFEEMEDRVLRSCTGLRNFVKIIKNNYKIYEGKIDYNNLSGFGGGNLSKNSSTKNNIQEEFSSGDENSSTAQQSEDGVSFSSPNSFGTFTTKSTENGVGKVHKKGSGFPTKTLGNDGGIGLLRPSQGREQEIIIFDNHNHALYFWCDAVRQGILEPGFELIHIDEHSDLWENQNHLDLEKAIQNEQYAWEFTNLSCNVGNYIQPALRAGLISKMIRIENEYQIDIYMDYTPPENSILNIDIDIFAPELDHIPEEKKIRMIKNLIKKVKYVTIATSPYFIDQGKAIAKMIKILEIP